MRRLLLSINCWRWYLIGRLAGWLNRKWFDSPYVPELEVKVVAVDGSLELTRFRRKG